jgi:hypothetical protein
MRILKRKVYDNGINIYILLKQLKKQQIIPPEEVITKICNRFLERPKGRGYAWFKVSLIMATSEYNARKAVEESKKWKKTGIPESIKEIMRGM